jgi:cytochrome c oxidase subunit 2
MVMNKSVAFIASTAVIAMMAAGLGLHAQESQPRVLTIAARRFEFTPSQITVKRGEPVTLRVSAEDRDHGFYQKDMGIDLDLSPEHASDVTITPEKAGRFVVICDHFCGSGHGNMKMVINVE